MEGENMCDLCKTKPALSHCGGLCGIAMYCSQECATQHFNEGHRIECPEKISKIIVEMGGSSFERRGFYKASIKKMKDLYKNDIFGWFAIQIYMHSPFINKLLFATNGDWSKFNNRFDDIYKSHARIKRRTNPANPYDKFNTFFADTLHMWQFEFRKVILGDAGGKYIRTQKDLLSAYPKLKPYFKMSNARFAYQFALHIQKAITSIPKSVTPLYAYRGYTVLNIPNTLTIDVDSMYIGQRIVTWGFTSISVTSEVSAGFLKQQVYVNQPTCCLLRVLIPANHNIFLISGTTKDRKYSSTALVTHGQAEILLPAGTILQVTHKQQPMSVMRDFSTIPIYTKWADVMVVGISPALRTKPGPK